jgi:hypothetical protein
VGEAFGRYSGGVFGTDESAKCTGANHAVVLVGWDDAQGIWYLRNSWGTRWGESGLMRIKYGTSRVGWDASHVVYGQTPYMPVGGTSQQTIRIFLPAVSRNSGAISDDSVPVPTPTPTPTPPPNPAPMAPANGGFEDGRVKWTEYSKQGWQVILDGNDLLVAPHAGSWATWLGGDHSEVASISQTVLVPSTSPYLAYWHWINSGDSCGKDVARVVVNSTVVASYDLCATHNTPGWAQRVVDLSAHAGRTVTLQIKVETDSAGVSNLYIDDVWFQSTLVAAPPPPPSDSPLTVASRPGT